MDNRVLITDLKRALFAALLTSTFSYGSTAPAAAEDNFDQPRGVNQAFGERALDADSAAPRGRIDRPEDQENADRIRVDSNVKMQGDLSPQEQSALSVAGGRLLMHVDRARDLLASNNADAAKSQVHKALTLAQIIERNAPTFQLNTTISAGDLQYADSDTIPSTVIPVYSEVSQISLIAPIARAKSSHGPAMNRNEQSRTNQRIAQNRNSVTENMAQPTTVSDVALASTGVFLDVDGTKDLLEQVSDDLQANNSDRAQQHLQSIQQNVFLTFSAVDQPLVQARENLSLARAYAQSNRMDPAKKALSEAARALNEFENNTSQERAKDINNVRGNITNLHDNFPDNAEQAAQRIQSLWQQLNGWSA